MGIISYPEFAQFIPVKCDFYYCQTDVLNKNCFYCSNNRVFK